MHANKWGWHPTKSSGIHDNDAKHGHHRWATGDLFGISYAYSTGLSSIILDEVNAHFITACLRSADAGTPLASRLHRRAYAHGVCCWSWMHMPILTTSRNPTTISTLLAQFSRFIFLLVWNQRLRFPTTSAPLSAFTPHLLRSLINFCTADLHTSHLGSRNGCTKWAHIASTAAETSPGPAVSLQDRQDSGCRLILGGERVRAH
jgi:hypothetical protein